MGTLTETFDGQMEAASGEETVPFDYSIASATSRSMDERTFEVASHRVTIEQAFKEDGKGGTDIGFGANVYNSSFVLSAYLAEHLTDKVRGSRVVEVGCGTGLVAISCGLLGASQVYATDGDAPLLELTQRNIERNDVAATVQTHQLLWGDKEEDFFA